MIWCRLLEVAAASTSTQAELVHGREQREGQWGVCGTGSAASSLRGRAQRAECLHSSASLVLLGLLRPSFCCGSLWVCKALQHFPAQQPALGKQERVLGSADGFLSFLRYFLRVGSGGGLSQSLGVAVPLKAFPKCGLSHLPCPCLPSAPPSGLFQRAGSRLVFGILFVTPWV